MKLYARKIKTETKAAEHETAHDLLKAVIQATYGIAMPTIAIGTHGKPYFPTRPDISFNLSHCKGMAICGIGAYPMGVDVEWIRPLRAGVLRRAFSEAETEAVKSSIDPDCTFFQLWTLKESYVKALGIGISYPLKQACFHLSADGLLHVRQHPPDWQFRLFSLDGFSIACCIAPEETPPNTIIMA